MPFANAAARRASRRAHDRAPAAACGFAALAFGVAGCTATQPTAAEAEFLVAVVGEQFVMRVRDPETIRLARENLQGRNSAFPAGPLRRGDGGFNAPWSWHLDPAEVRLTEAAIEVCDGLPSYVESHQAEFPTYCPWAARIVAER
jgi:hypothetical protein